MGIGRNDEAAGAAERVARDSYGRLIAYLAARTRDVAGAEDALSDAFAAALRLWPVEGIPRNPDAWLLTVARRRQTDAHRRDATRRAGEDHVKLVADEIEHAARTADAIPDRRLALMFACAHPAIERGMRAPLMLQTILGLTAQDIAAAFLVPPGAMGQRLVRAKSRIREAGIPFTIPAGPELPDRLEAVLDAIYAAYARGWAEIDGTDMPAMADEALWLGQLVVALLPAEPEALGMLALMLYAEARRAARRDPSGAYVPLEEQDTSLWDDSQIQRAESLLHAANRAGPSGRYQLEAAIQSAHAARRLAGVDNRAAIVALYDHLLARTRSPVVALNRAIALAEIDGPAAGLAALGAIADDRRMQTYQPYWAARAHLLAATGDREAALAAVTVAIGLATDPAIRAWLGTRRDALRHG